MCSNPEIISDGYTWLMADSQVARLHLRRKKNLWFRFPTDPIFSADPIIFSTRLTVRPYFLRVVAGCSKMASVVTLIIEPNCLNSSIGNTHL